MEIKKVKIYTLGCKVNQYDGAFLARQLVALGLKKVNNKADLAIINSCAVTKTAIRKNRNMINKARQENPEASIMIIGCWPKVYNNDVKKSIAQAVILSKEEVLPFIKHKYGLNIEAGKKKIIFNKNRSRYFLKAQDGCNQFCSYCIIPYARGVLKSREVNEVVEELRQAIKAGYQEIVICGIHLGLYGKDLKEKIDLCGLIKRIIKIKNLGRVRLSSIEVTEVGKELINLIAGSRKICRHLHIPLQSGSNKILKLMARPYTTKYFADKIKKIRKIMPDIAITTDVIVGFPGESDNDFNETFELVKKLRFGRLHVFPFSAHEKTPAAKMAGQVDGKEIRKRADKLRIIGKKLEQDYKNKFIGKTLDVAIERQDKNILKGKTEYYFDVSKKINTKKNKVGTIVKIKNTV